MHVRSLLILPLLLPTFALADTTLQYTSSTHPDHATIIQVRDGDVLMGDKRSKMLFKDGKQELVIIDHRSKSFMVFDEETAKRLEQQMGAMQQQMSAAMAQMEKEMENMSEEQKAQIRQMMGNQMPSGGARKPLTTTVKQQGKETVAGVTCSQMQVLVNGKPTGDVCVATAGVLSVETKDYEAMVKATDTISKIMERMSGNIDNDAVSMNLRAMRGIPVRMRDLADGDVSTLESRSSADLDPAIFQVPAGYHKQDMLQ